MDFFHDVAKEQEVPTRQAFTAARKKVSYHAFKDFFEKSCELVVSNPSPKLHNGYHILAIDGTSFIVGDHKKLSSYFGETTTVEGRAMCRLSAVVDVLDGSIASGEVAPFSEGERSLALKQVKALKVVPNALYLFDRGYWSHELISEIINNGQSFLMRIPSRNKQSSVVDSTGQTIELRRLSCTLTSGEEEILVTNLPKESLTDEEIFALYPYRWGAETKYLELKSRLQIDKFSCTSVNEVLQDIYCTLYISNLVAFVCEASDEEIESKTAIKANKYKQKTNRSVCIATLRKRFTSLYYLDDPRKLQKRLDIFYRDLSRCVIYENKSKPKPRNKRKIKAARAHRSPILL